VLGLTALIVALAGTADAGPSHPIVRKGDIAKGAVTANALAKGAVRARALAPGAVGAKALANGSISAAALRPGAVSATALAPNAVSSSALAPGSVYGAALGPVSSYTSSLIDLDTVEENGTWTASDTAIAACKPGERLITGGVVFTNPGNREVAIVQALPFVSPDGSGMTGQITTNSGGKATAQVQAICLK
jgi:hypothetical protein